MYVVLALSGSSATTTGILHPKSATMFIVKTGSKIDGSTLNVSSIFHDDDSKRSSKFHVVERIIGDPRDSPIPEFSLVKKPN